MYQEYNRKLILEDGSEYFGYAFGSEESRVCEMVFNTSMAGYQEILSDPSYTCQAVVMTYPLIGNYGICEADFETDRPTIGGLIVREYNDTPSNFRSACTLSQTMKQFGIPGIWGVDTRKLTRQIRSHGSCKVLLTSMDTTAEEGKKLLTETELPKDVVAQVSCSAPKVSCAENQRFHVAAIDCGMKKNIVRSLNRRGCRVTILPWNTSAREIEELHPHGIFLSNGPGNPEDVQPVIETVRALMGRYPMFGICLGHQIISLACGARTYKLKFGHRGGNHPVRNLETGKIEITSQNHSYAVDADSIAGTGLTITHMNILDQTVEGVKNDAKQVFSVQYHPESAPGPQDSAYLFDRFINLMEEAAHHA